MTSPVILEPSMRVRVSARAAAERRKSDRQETSVVFIEGSSEGHVTGRPKPSSLGHGETFVNPPRKSIYRRGQMALSGKEKELAESARKCATDALPFLRSLVEINSGSGNLAGIEQVGDRVK